MAELVELALVKQAVGIKAEDDTRDDLLNQAIGGASYAIRRRCGRSFNVPTEATTIVLETQGRMLWDGRRYTLLVPDVAKTDDFSLDGDPNARLVNGNPDQPGWAFEKIRTSSRPDEEVTITAWWGWLEVPPDIASAALMQATRLYRRKDSPEGIGGSAEWGLFRVPRLDPDVQAMIEPFILPGIA